MVSTPVGPPPTTTTSSVPGVAGTFAVHRFLQQLLQVPPQPLGVGHRVQRERVLGRAGDSEEVRPCTRRHHHMRTGERLPSARTRLPFGQRGSRHIRGEDCHRG